MHTKIYPFLVAICAVFAPQFALASAGSFDAVVHNVAPNTEFTVTVNATGLSTTGSMDVLVEYDPTYVSFVSVAPGLLMEPLLDTLFATATVASKEQVLVSVLSLDSISGDGEVATLTFRTKAVGGTSNISMEEMKLFAYDFPFDESFATVGPDAVLTVVVPDTTLPTITAFVIPATATTLAVSVTTFNATDNVAVTQYCLRETNSSAGCVWGAKPTSYTFATEGAKTLYAFVRDAAGNVSLSATDAVTITLPPAPDTTAPTITAFVIPATATTLAVSVTTFNATDNVAVTQYCLRETNSSVGCVWGAKPTSYTFATEGAKTLYAFVRDAAGNVSLSATDAVTITLPPAPDTTAPVRSSLSPSGTIARDTTSTTLSVTTNENAVCRYSATAGTAFALGTAFTTTGNTTHTTVVSGLTNGNSYTYYVRCADGLSNTNLDDASITFSVQANASTGGSSGGGGGGGSSSKDTDAPRGISIVINKGAQDTTTRQVNLALTARDENKTILMQVSESKTFSGAKWVDFKTTSTWTLSQGNGLRTLYARFKDGKGNTSSAVSDTITLTEAGAPTYVAPVTSKPAVQSVSTYTFTRTMGLGTQGADVVALQKRLRSEGLFTYPTNSGYYGAVTAEAVKLFQRKYGIEATGFVGPITMQKLNTKSAIQKDDSGLSLEGLIKLFLALGIIPKEKADVAYTALKQL